MVRLTILYDLDAFVDERRFFARQRRWVKDLQGDAADAPRLHLERVERVYASHAGPPPGFITTLEWDRDAAFRVASEAPAFAWLVSDVRALSANAVVLVSTTRP